MKILAYGMIIIALVIIVSSFSSAVTVNSVIGASFVPGKDSTMTVEIKNTLQDDVDDLSLNLQLSATRFIAVGSSEESVNELREGDYETFTFVLRSAYDTKPGDYLIPYTISYRKHNADAVITRTGSIGVSVVAQPELDFSLNEEMAVVGTQGKIILKIINNGLADARFVSIKVRPLGYTLLSDNEAYIGSISSDDFESTSFDVRFTNENPVFRADIEYRDLDNAKLTKEVDIPFLVYTRERALELGIVKNSKVPYYIGAAVVIIVAWFVWRALAKRRRMRASLRN